MDDGCEVRTEDGVGVRPALFLQELFQAHVVDEPMPEGKKVRCHGASKHLQDGLSMPFGDQSAQQAFSLIEVFFFDGLQQERTGLVGLGAG